MITIDTATEKDILEFSKNIRSMDAKEVEFVSGKPFTKLNYHRVRLLLFDK